MNCTIDLTCPAEIFRTAMPTDEIPAASLTLFNLSDRVISSVEVCMRLLDEDGEEAERLSYRGRALNGRPHSTFLLTVPCAPSPGIKGIDASVEKVWYADNETWRRDPANAVIYTPNALPISPALTKLKYAAGETAVGYPSMQEGLWVCVCGRPNPEGEACCARCGRRMEEVFSLFTPEAVEARITLKERQLDVSSRNIREDTIRLQRIREEEYKQKKARRGSRIRVFISMLLALGLTAAVLFHGAPLVRLMAGKRALENGDPAGAKAVFRALGSYGDARELMDECDWQLAQKAAENSTTAEELAQASALLRAVKDRSEAIDIANEKDMMRGRLLQGQGLWQEALEAVALLPEDYPGMAELKSDCRFAQARELHKEKKYSEAREIYLSLGDYPGAREYAADCIYEPAMERMDAKDWDGAISMLSACPDYKDSRNKTLECHYRKAEEMLEAGDAAGASNEFLLAGDWEDAPERCRSLTYARAKELYEAGDIKGAQSLYASIPDYQDANDMDKACRYLLAKDAADDLEYSLVLELLKDVPDDYRDTADLRAEAVYQRARAAIRREDWASAVELLQSTDREAVRSKHRDVENLYIQACEKLGVDPYPETGETDGSDEADETAAPRETPEPDPEATVNPFLVVEEEAQ